MLDQPCLRLGTHDQAFHGDDVLACAILTTIFTNHQIIRTRDPDILNLTDIVFDVGGIYDHTLRRYDHHMRNPPIDRDSDHMLSSAGLIWRHYAKSYLQAIGIPKNYTDDHGTLPLQSVVERIVNQRWIIPVDRQDNGFSHIPTPISEIVSALQPIDAQKSRQQYNDQFREAVSIVSHLFKRSCFHSVDNYIRQAQFSKTILTYRMDGRIMIAPITLPSIRSIQSDRVHFVIYPVEDFSGEEPRIMIRAMKDYGSSYYRTPFPEETWGCDAEQLEALGYKGVQFVHHTGFIARAENETAAVDFCEKLLR